MKTKKQIETIELEKYRLTVTLVFIGFVLFFGIIGVNIKADQIVHLYKRTIYTVKNILGKIRQESTALAKCIHF